MAVEVRSKTDSSQCESGLRREKCPIFFCFASENITDDNVGIIIIRKHFDLRRPQSLENEQN